MIFVTLPCLNEAENLKIIIPQIHKIFQNNNYEYKILVCYDCSTDDTESVVNNLQKEYNIELLPYQNKRGLGIAFLRLFQTAIKESQSDDDVIISLDADNTHDPNGMLLIMDKIESGYDVAIQSRFCDNSSMSGFPFFRKMISNSISLIMRTFFPVGEKGIKDYTSSYRGYKVGIFKKVFEKYKNNFITETEFTYTIESIIKLGIITNKITETPLQYKYDKKIGKSKLRLFKNGKRFIILFFKLLTVKN